MKAKIESLKNIASDILEIILTPVNTKAFPSFHPGAHVEISFAEGHYKRNYSLVSDPLDTSYYTLAVLKAQNGLGGSKWIHENLSEGMQIDCSNPINGFNIVDGNHHVLLAGGIGVTPILSFARFLKFSKKSFELHYSARSIERMAYRELISSQFQDECRLYFDANSSILNLDDVVRNYDEGVHLYVCGPRGMIEAVKNKAAQKKWRKDHVHYESFGSTQVSVNHFQVELIEAKILFEVHGNDTILDVARKKGVLMPYGCLRGECGACVVEYRDGEVAHHDVCLSEEERKTKMCPCVSKVKSSSIKIKF